MRDLDVFVKLLALRRPWAVDRLAFEAKTTMLTIHLRHRSNARLRCPECDTWLPVYDHTPLRYWRHLDHGGWLTYLAARVPRVHCLFHGLRRVDVPWALPGARFWVPLGCCTSVGTKPGASWSGPCSAAWRPKSSASLRTWA
jgi:transposase